MVHSHAALNRLLQYKTMLNDIEHLGYDIPTWLWQHITSNISNTRLASPGEILIDIWQPIVCQTLTTAEISRTKPNTDKQNDDIYENGIRFPVFFDKYW